VPPLESHRRASGSSARSRALVAGLAAAALVIGAGAWGFYKHGRRIWVPWKQKLVGQRSVKDVIAALEPGAGARIRDALSAAAIAPAPGKFWLLAVKDARTLDLFGEDASGRRVKVRSWRVLAASGSAGPKLREGDRQVPEGVYRIDHLNPNSAYHLSLALDYPNAVDRAHAAHDGRNRPGGDIFIHGKDVSIGCLAIGDDAIEELFWLAATAGKDAFTVVIVPTDLRQRPAPDVRAPPWVTELYGDLRAELVRFP